MGRLKNYLRSLALLAANETEEERAARKKEAIRKEMLAQQSARNHRPGARHAHPDGTAYVVDKTGAWRRMTARASVVNHHNQKNKGVKRREGRV